MAPKSSSLSHQPSKDEDEREESSSGEEEEEESEPQSSKEDSSDDESTDDEIGNRRTLALGSLRSPIPAPKFDPQSNSRRSELDSDADSDGSPSDYKVQPIAAAKSKRGRGEIQGDSMRSCKSSRGEEKKSPSTGTGVGCINRLWSFEDEKAVLDGMIEFKSARGFDPAADMGAFYGFIKGKLKVDFTKDQLRTKVAGMKKRFLNAVKKAEKGSDPVFSKPHEDMAFLLSKRIWGENEKRVVEERGKDGDIGEGGDFWSKYPNINASFDNVRANFPSLVAPVAGMSLLKEKLSLIGNVKAKELDNKWKQLYVEECRLSYKTLVLMKEQVEMALDQ